MEPRAADLTRRACEVLEGAGAGVEVTAQPPWPGVLALLARRCIDCLREQGPRLPSITAAQLGMIVSELQHLALELDDRQMAGDLARIRSCEATLIRLRALNGSADLLSGVCRSVAQGCGFARVVLSRVDNGESRPWMAYSARPVCDAHDLTRTGRSTSYVAAPIVLGGEVIGFLHADHDGRRSCDELDREILHAFSEGFALLYERAVLLEQMQARCANVREALADAETTLTRLTVGEPAIGRASTGRGAAELTPRELDVLELMVAGATNQMIADQLHIGVGTVKSHVKRILRKLGACNRSNAIARYLAMAGT
jgi:DNA-binding CsgD family transcriptional regulator